MHFLHPFDNVGVKPFQACGVVALLFQPGTGDNNSEALTNAFNATPVVIEPT